MPNKIFGPFSLENLENGFIDYFPPATFNINVMPNLEFFKTT